MKITHTKEKDKTTDDYVSQIWNFILQFMQDEYGDPKTMPKLILTAVNSNIQSKENKDIYVKGLAKVAIDSSIMINV